MTDLRRLIGVLIASTALIACDGTTDDTTDPGTDSDTQFEPDSDTTQTTAGGPPGAFQQPHIGASSGVMTSDSHSMVFSLGGQLPPAVGSTHSINSPPTEDSP